MLRNYAPASAFVSAVVFVVLVWLVYVSVKVAQHVQAWPF